MPRSELGTFGTTFFGEPGSTLLFYPNEETLMAISQQEIEAHEALFWTAPDGFQFPILINLTEGDDGVWRL